MIMKKIVIASLVSLRWSALNFWARKMHKHQNPS